MTTLFAVDPFKMSSQQELEKSSFTSSVNRLKKKVNSMETIMYSQPYADAKEDFVNQWNNKLNKILSDDCGLNALTALRNSKITYGREDSAEYENRKKVKTPVAALAPVAKKKKVKMKIGDLASRKPFAGGKIEFETIGTIPNYRGGNSIHTGTRVLRRLGPQGQEPLRQTSVPPWIGPTYYKNRTADRYLYEKPATAFQAPFKTVAREHKKAVDYKDELELKKEWSGLFNGPGSVYGGNSIPFSASRSSSSRHADCQSGKDDHNVWSKMSASTTLGAKQPNDHYLNAVTPILGPKSRGKHRSSRKIKLGVIDDNTTIEEIGKGRIFDTEVVDSVAETDNLVPDDDLSVESSIFGDDEMKSISASSLSTQKRLDTISLLSKSVNFSTFTGFSIDKVLLRFVAQQKMKHQIADYTMGALDAYNDSVVDRMEFTDPRLGELAGTRKSSPRFDDTEDKLPPEMEHVPEGISTISFSQNDISSHRPSVRNKRGSIADLLSLKPQNTRSSISHAIPKILKPEDIAKVPPRRSCRRTAIVPITDLDNKTMNDMSQYTLEEASSIEISDSPSVQTLPGNLTRSYSNFMSEKSRVREVRFARSKSNLNQQDSETGAAPTLRLQQSGNLSRSFSRSPSKLSYEETKLLMETGLSVDLGGLLLPGEAVDPDGTAAAYSPPETPRIDKNATDSTNSKADDDEDLFTSDDEGDERCSRRKMK